MRWKYEDGLAANTAEGDGIHGPSVELVSNATAAPTQLADWVDLAVVGEWRGHPTRPYELTPQHLAAMHEYFQRRYAANGVDLVIDYEHQSLVAKFTGKPAPAAGWITDVRLVEDGARLQGRVKWTDTARNFIESRQYRYLSPVYDFDYADPTTARKLPVVLTAVALTNRPFVSELAPIANTAGTGAQQKEGHMDLAKLAQLWQCTPAEAAQRLGVKEDADADTVANSLAALGAKVPGLEKDLAERKEAVEAAGERHKAVANALGVAEDADLTAVKAAVIRLKAPGAGLGAVANSLGLSQDAGADEVLAKVRELQGAGKTGKVKQLVENAIAQRKILPAQRDWWEKQAEEDLEAATQVINGLPAILDESGKMTPPPGDGGTVPLTDEEKQVANSLGVAETTAARDKAEFLRSQELRDEFVGNLGAFLAVREEERQGRMAATK